MITMTNTSADPIVVTTEKGVFVLLPGAVVELGVHMQRNVRFERGEVVEG